MAVESRRTGTFDIGIECVTGNRDHVRRRKSIRTQLPRELVAIETWQSDVQQEDVGLEIMRGLQAALAIMRTFHDKAMLAQEPRESDRGIDVVIDYQDSLGGSRYRCND